MNNNAFKNIVVTVSTLCCLTSISSVAHAKLSNAEREYVYQLTNHVVSIANFLNNTFSSFIDTKDRTAYSVYVKSLNQEIDKFECQVLSPLATKIIEAKNNRSYLFHDGLTLVYDVLNDFLTRINTIRPILVKYISNDSSSASRLVSELKPHLLNLADPKIMANLVAKIDQLYKLMIEAGENALGEQIQMIKESLNASKTNPALKKRVDQLLIVTCLTTKLRYNKMHLQG